MSHLFEDLEKEETLNQLKIDLLSRFYFFNRAELIEYSDELNFGYYYLMENESINWDYELIDLLKDKIDWDGLWKIKNIIINYDFIKKYEGRIDFQTLALSKFVNWTTKILEDFEDKLDWSSSINSISLFNNYEILKKYSERLNWDKVSLFNESVSDEKFIIEFENKLNWQKLSANKNLHISPEFLMKHRDKLDINLISKNTCYVNLIFKYPNEIEWNWDNVIVNPGINYDEISSKFIFENYYKYYKAQNKRIKTKDFAIRTFLHRIFEFYPNDKTYFLKEEFQKFINWENISSYNDTKLPLDFIIANKTKFNFKNHGFISDHRDIITTKFIEDNLGLFDTTHYSFYYLPITKEIIKKLGEMINWNNLSSCIKFNWTWEFIEENLDKLNLHRVSKNKGVYDLLLSKSIDKCEILKIINK
jgi:hypothetical protein